MSNEQIPAQFATDALDRNTVEWADVITSFVICAAISFGYYLFSGHFNLYILIPCLPVIAVRAFFNYRRLFQPERVPALLAEGSDELARLKATKQTLDWLVKAGLICLAMVFVIGRHVGLLNHRHGSTTSDEALCWMMLPIGFCALWGIVLEAYIKERTPPAAKTASSGGSRNSSRVISGKAFQGNALHSDHWGERVSESAGEIESVLNLPVRQ